MTPLWDWVLDAYARPGVAETCLRLQDDYGQNTSLLLWAIRARPDDEAVLDQAARTARSWDETTLVPLRAVRRGLKAPLPPVDDAAREGLREDVKAAELRAERVLVETLERLGEGARPAGSALEAVTAATRAWGRAAPVETLAALTDAVA
ncbi:MAG TPA: TIGR02444 family protein [Phenylobacterium sp.]|uniref:TIGR02444 family protein n=1 Tax=Phenylobacterium sp. TaxID=1871053 RepID=UPI002B4607C0|nr:TIGR02444 family protein [Phenylobacterium sp.]HKR89166.1 TIGR02444 family protein [Phenylobacterium sp.]